MSELRLVIPITPPSGNNYMRNRVVFPKGGGRAFVQWYPTEEAEAWWGIVAAIAQGRKVISRELEISYIVFQAASARADVDNYAKCIFDALTKARVIEDDRYVMDFHGHKRPDSANPRTVIVVKGRQEQLFERI